MYFERKIFMIIDLSSGPEDISGQKATSLALLKENGFCVPDGFYITGDSCLDWLEGYGLRAVIEADLGELLPENAEEISERILARLSGCVLQENVREVVAGKISESGSYAVRSSGALEDLEGMSFAGQYQTSLYVRGIDDISVAIVNCYRSVFSKENLTYLCRNGLRESIPLMAVIVQDMVEAEFAGVGFTIDPISGDDKTFRIEVVRGACEQLVSGHMTPVIYQYNWYEEVFEGTSDFSFLNKKRCGELTKALLDIQVFFGYPCDVEFAFDADGLHILQARPITGIQYQGIRDQWTTANFKDGGVSSKVCTPFMWSLYEYVWEYSMKKFLLESKLFREKELRKLGRMFFGRPYWNLSIAKEAMLKVPGFVEREFDEELGVTIQYEGDGRRSKMDPAKMFTLLRVVRAHFRIAKRQSKSLETRYIKKMDQYAFYKSGLSEHMSRETVVERWYQLVKDDYLGSETLYFWQIFINTIRQPLFKSKLFRYVDYKGYLNLISGLGSVSHLRNVVDLRELCASIRADEKAFSYWTGCEPEAIKRDYLAKNSMFFLDAFSKHIDEYGYHSDRELDVSYPCFSEDVTEVICVIRNMLREDTTTSGESSERVLQEAYENQLQLLRQEVDPLTYRRLKKKILMMRTMLWWRENLKDISTRFYYLIRMYSIELAKIYVQEGVIDEVEDIWYLSIQDVFDHIDGKKSKEEIRSIIARNRVYTSSFRKFKNDNEVCGAFGQVKAGQTEDPASLRGVGCSDGIVVGRARVIENVSELHTINPGDILVTHFTDTGWTSKFTLLQGIVTEFGGALCHAAIIAREYGVPCIVSCENATRRIRDGAMIAINGVTGEIQIKEA
jgi:pyruvate,water dikinase